MGLEETNPAAEDRFAVAAHVLREIYASDAEAVAIRQIEHAGGPVRDDWMAILDHLRR